MKLDTQQSITHTDPVSGIRITETIFAPVWASVGMFLFALMVGVGLLIGGVVRLHDAAWVLYGSFVMGALPLFTFGVMQFHRMLLDHGFYRKGVQAAEKALNTDIDGDGVVGESEKVGTELNDYERTVFYWLSGGSTLRDDTCEAVGIEAKDWQVYRDKALRIETPNGMPPVFIRVGRQGKGYGLIPHPAWRQRWHEVQRLI